MGKCFPNWHERAFAPPPPRPQFTHVFAFWDSIPCNVSHFFFILELGLFVGVLVIGERKFFPLCTSPAKFCFFYQDKPLLAQKPSVPVPKKSPPGGRTLVLLLCFSQLFCVFSPLPWFSGRLFSRTFVVFFETGFSPPFSPGFERYFP